ncbi:unnamed protein product [Schistosoma margrebowiei]|uniref:Uncharacterized protein n=1 Tax=Schistosoma margrebowiei TaxID=48269 RepID=A0A183LZ03_9TREM|nr:unnamed protein product [Schistosoma margrebowiei]
MVVGGSQQETLDPGFVLLDTRQQGVPVIMRELVLPGGFDLVSPSFSFIKGFLLTASNHHLNKHLSISTAFIITISINGYKKNTVYLKIYNMEIFLITY